MVRAEVIRCLRDPDCKNHPWHGGHVVKLNEPDPRVMYAARKRRKDAGMRAWNLVRRMEIGRWSPQIKMDRMQRHALFVAIRDELLTAHFQPLGQY
jgi:hypothetical protein